MTESPGRLLAVVLATAVFLGLVGIAYADSFTHRRNEKGYLEYLATYLTGGYGNAVRVATRQRTTGLPDEFRNRAEKINMRRPVFGGIRLRER